MNAAKLLTGLCVAFALNANALEIPSKSREDNRIQYASYSVGDVTKINAVNGYITTIIFSPSEVVENFGSGFSTAWEFSASQNHFFLKPKDRNGTTNIVVVTSKRVYSIDVHLVNDPKNATYQLIYRYPDEIAKVKHEEKKKKDLEDLTKKPDPNVLHSDERIYNANYQYTMNFGKNEHSVDLAPKRVFDDGRFTYFKFRRNHDMPAIYAVTTDGEAIVQSHVENGVVVVHGVFEEYRLRAGTAVCGIYNDDFSGGSTAPNTSTTVSGLQRKVK